MVFEAPSDGIEFRGGINLPRRRRFFFRTRFHSPWPLRGGRLQVSRESIRLSATPEPLMARTVPPVLFPKEGLSVAVGRFYFQSAIAFRANGRTAYFLPRRPSPVVEVLRQLGYSVDG